MTRFIITCLSNHISYCSHKGSHDHRDLVSQNAGGKGAPAQGSGGKKAKQNTKDSGLEPDPASNQVLTASGTDNLKNGPSHGLTKVNTASGKSTGEPGESLVDSSKGQSG